VLRLIDYPTVLQTLEESGLRCVYPHSGAFGLKAEAKNQVIGWIGGEDGSIRPEVRAVAQVVPWPAPRSLTSLLARAWREHLNGPIWLMPTSHWAFELQFGAADWLPELLAEHSIDAQSLRARSDGSAIEFQPDQTDRLRAMVERLLDRMTTSDFNLAFPGRPVLAMLHHHQQIWWQTSDPAILQSIRAIPVST
jgi:hypothetical protein